MWLLVALVWAGVGLSRMWFGLSRGRFAVVEHDRVVSMRLDERKATATDARVEQVDRTDAACYADHRVRCGAALVEEVDTHIGAHVQLTGHSATCSVCAVVRLVALGTCAHVHRHIALSPSTLR